MQSSYFTALSLILCRKKVWLLNDVKSLTNLPKRHQNMKWNTGPQTCSHHILLLIHIYMFANIQTSNHSASLHNFKLLDTWFAKLLKLILGESGLIIKSTAVAESHHSNVICMAILLTQPWRCSYHIHCLSIHLKE